MSAVLGPRNLICFLVQSRNLTPSRLMNAEFSLWSRPGDNKPGMLDFLLDTRVIRGLRQSDRSDGRTG